MVMLSFDNMDLSKIGLEAIDPADLYCQDNSPLQNQTLYPGCYGICANPDISGIGYRLLLYAQSLLILWLANITPNPNETPGALLAVFTTTFTIFVATLVQCSRNKFTFHHTFVTINLISMPNVAFLFAIVRMRLQPKFIPLGPKLFATPILILQLLACAVLVAVGIGLNTVLKQADFLVGGVRDINGWQVAQQQCNPDTKIIIFGVSLQFWAAQTVEEVSNLPEANRIVLLVLYGIMIFLPLIGSIVCLYTPHTGRFHLFAHYWYRGKKSSHWLLLTVLFALSNAWIVVLIYATEKQIRRNHILPGENNWDAGQILAAILTLVSVIKAMIAEIGERSTRARGLIQRRRLDRILGIRFDTDP